MTNAETVCLTNVEAVPRARLALGWALFFAVVFSSALNLFQLSIPLYSMQVFDRVLPSRSLSTLAILTILVVILVTCSIFLDSSRSFILNLIGCRLDLDHFPHAAELAFNSRFKSISRMRDVDTVRGFFMSPAASSLLDLPWSLVSVAALLLLHPMLGIITFGSMSLTGAMAFWGHAATRKPRRKSLDATNAAEITIRSARLDQEMNAAMGLRPRLLATLKRQRVESLSCTFEANKRQAWLNSTSRGLRSLVQVAVTGIAALLVVNGNMQAGSIVASSMLFLRAMAPVDRLGACIGTVSGFLEAWKRLRKAEFGAAASGPRLTLPPVQGKVTVEKLGLSVPRARKPLLSDVTFALEPGSLLVIVGSEGSGKSTLARLLTQVFTPTTGTIRIDGSKLSDFDCHDLGCQIGYAPQELHLNAGRVSDIIARGASGDDEEITAAALRVGAHAMIQSLPEGYNTRLEDGTGATLSAGQRRRLALARAFYRTPRLIVLDEPTLGLDDRGENSLVSAIAELKKGGTSFIVISRCPPLLNMLDQYMILENGQVEALVSGEALRRSTELRLVRSQTAETSVALSFDDRRRP